MKKLISLVLVGFLSQNLNAELNNEMKSYILSNESPSLFKVMAAMSYQPGNKEGVELKEAINLYQEVIERRDNAELRRYSHYSLAELFYEIYFSNPSKYEYKEYGEQELRNAIKMSHSFNFVDFKIDKKSYHKQYPPKMILDDLLDVPAVKLLYHVYYMDYMKHSDFHYDYEEAKIYLDDLININYTPAYSYALGYIQIELLKEVLNFRKREVFNNALSAIDLFLELEKFYHRELRLDREYYKAAKKQMKKINKMVISSIDELQSKSQLTEQRANKLKEEWNDNYEKITFSSYESEDATKKYQELMGYKKNNKEQIKENRKKFKEESRKYEEKRQKILRETGKDIADDNIFDKMLKNKKEHGRVFQGLFDK